MYHLGNMFQSSWAMPGLGFSPLGNILLYAVLIWSVVWKGLALWKSARVGSKVWFIVFLVVNTLGILEILYLYVFSKKKSLAMAEEKK
ncbi:MAG: DUF5652 family protein [Minisyncoccia bacterium]|jgi:methionyl-tRNA synthetase